MKKSAGILMYRFSNKQLEVLLAHPGGPFWKNRDIGAWTIPKGEFNDDEAAFTAAVREFEEELGIKPQGNFIGLSPVKQKSGKFVYAWAVEGNIDTNAIRSNSFEMEWPPRSGKMQRFPEIDKAGWFNIPEAKEKILPAQVSLLEELQHLAVV